MATTPVITVVTANLLRSISTEAFKESLESLLKTDADLIGLQEVGARRRILETLPGWDVWMPDHPRASQEAILYRKGIKLRGAGARKMIDGTTQYPERWATWVEVEHRERSVVHINTHCIPHVDLGGKPRDLPRVKANTQHLVRLGLLYRTLANRGTAFVTADFNVDYRRDRIIRDRRFPYAQLTRRGLCCSYETMGLPRTGTHGKRRLIDHVWHEQDATPIAQKVLPRLASDHRPVLVKFKLP